MAPLQIPLGQEPLTEAVSAYLYLWFCSLSSWQLFRKNTGIARSQPLLRPSLITKNKMFNRLNALKNKTKPKAIKIIISNCGKKSTGCLLFLVGIIFCISTAGGKSCSERNIKRITSHIGGGLCSQWHPWGGEGQTCFLYQGKQGKYGCHPFAPSTCVRSKPHPHGNGHLPQKCTLGKNTHMGFLISQLHATEYTNISFPLITLLIHEFGLFY